MNVPLLIEENSIRWCSWGNDNNGRVFHYRGEYYRAILPASEPLFRQLLDEGILDAIADLGLIVRTAETHLQLEGYRMILHHERVPFVSYPQEWCFSMLRDAGKLILEVNRRLLRYGLVLADGHSRNVLFRGSRPVFVDIGSIIPIEPDAPYPAYSEFLSSFIYPLALQQRPSMQRVVRHFLDDESHGITDDEYRVIQKRKIPSLRLSLRGRTIDANWLYLRLSRNLLATKNRVVKGLSHLLWRLPVFSQYAPAAQAIEQLDRKLDQISISQRSSKWGEYYENSSIGKIDVDRMPKRDRQIRDTIIAARPNSLIDLAGNQGYFSVLAAQCGVDQVVCADLDLNAIEKLYAEASAQEHPILSIRLDVMRPCGGSTTLWAPQRAAHRRFQCDMALALALTHHLSLTQGIPFETIAATLATYTRSYLLVEFMPFGLGIGQPSPDLPDWYTIDHFRNAFARYFSTIQVMETDLECNHRTLLVCRK